MGHVSIKSIRELSKSIKSYQEHQVQSQMIIVSRVIITGNLERFQAEVLSGRETDEVGKAEARGRTRGQKVSLISTLIIINWIIHISRSTHTT